MKKQFYLLTIIFFALAIFNAPTAKADGWHWGNDNNDHNDKGDKHKNDNNLPINNGVLFLTIAGMGIGVIMIRKNKAVKTVVKG